MFKPLINHKAPHHRFYRLDRQSGGHGGVAITVNKELKHKHIPSPITSVIESVAVSVDTPVGEIAFISVYFPGTKVSSQVLDRFRNHIRSLTSINASYHICGDLNAKHRLWNNVKGNAASFTLYQELSRCPFNILHSPHPTQIAYINTRPRKCAYEVSFSAFFS